MTTLVGPILSYILLYKYPVLFVVQFLSALIVPFPANTTLAAVGAFAGEGYMSLTLSFFISLAGCVAGDVAGYLIARLLQKRVTRWIKSERWAGYLKRLDKAMRRYAGLTVFITRLTPGLEILVNFMAGLAEVPFGRFLFWDTLGNTLNAVLYMGAGYLIGADWQDIIGIFGLAGGILLVLVLIAATIVVYRIVIKKD